MFVTGLSWTAVSTSKPAAVPAFSAQRPLENRSEAEELGDGLLAKGKARTGAGAAGNHHQPDILMRRIAKRRVAGGRVGSGPACGHRRLHLRKQPGEFAEDQPVDLFRPEGVGRGAIVMGIADDQRAIGALGDDQMDAVGELPACSFSSRRRRAAASGSAA